MKLNFRNWLKGFNRLLRLRFRIFSVSIVVLIVGASYLLLLSPKIAEVREVGLFGLQETKDRLELKQNLLDLTRSLTDKYADLQLADIDQLRGMLPTEQDLPGLFVQVEALALASGLTLDNVNFSEATVEEVSAPVQTVPQNIDTTQLDPSIVTTVVQPRATLTIRKMTVSFVVSGGRGYDHLKEFLTNVESHLRLFDVQSLAYTPAPTGEEEIYSINAITYLINP